MNYDPQNGDGITFRTAFNAWWPDYDHDPAACFHHVLKGLPAIELVAKHCKQHRRCIQAGGHAGFWPSRLATHFEEVLTFEPESALFRCLQRNVGGNGLVQYPDSHKIICNPLGLGAACGQQPFKSARSAGSWRVDPDGEHVIDVVTIDSLALDDVDAILLDIEGYEPHALRGARETIRRCAPIILCELLPRSGKEITSTLAGMGYRQTIGFGKDGIFKHVRG